MLPGGRGNDFARVLGIPLEPVAACDVLARGAVRGSTSAIVGSRTFIGIASCGFDSDANRIANETRVVRGNLVYAYGAIRALLSWRPAQFDVLIDGDASRRVTGYTVAAANSKAYGGGMMLAPDASLEDGLLDVVIVGDVPKLRFLRLLPTVFKGTHMHQPNVEVLRAAEVKISADRPFTMYADGDPIAELPVDRARDSGRGPGDRAAMTVLSMKIAAARAVGGLARRAGRGGGTSLPGKVLMRLEPHAIGELAARLPLGSAVISATNGKTTTAAMTASVLERAGITLGSQPRRRQHGRRRRLDAARRRPLGREDRRRAGPVRGRRVLARPRARELDPRAVLLCNLFRDQLDRYGELETIADRWAAVVASLPAGPTSP